MKKINLPNKFFVLNATKIFVFSFCLLTFTLPPANALHRYHTSLTRMDYNEKEKLVEVTIQLFTHDLVPTLERRSKKNIDLEKTPDIDKLIFEYVDKNFVLKDRDNKEKKPVWVGKELEVDTVFVYIEIPLADGLSGAQLQNTIFFESFPEQTNLVALRLDGKKSDLLFVAGDKFKEILPTNVPGKN